MLDWSSLVSESLKEAPQKGPETAVFPQKVGTNPEGVGTKNIVQHIEQKEDFKSVPTVPSVPTVFERPRVEQDEKRNSLSFSPPGGGGAKGQFAPHFEARQSCLTCAYLCRPGLSDGHCGGRDDLPPAYGPGHPRRQLPPDGGASCSAWKIHPGL